MKILSTAGLLLATLLVVPVLTYYYGKALGPEEMDALKTLAWLTLGSVILTFTLGELTKNNSQVDKLWSILPIVYAWVAADHGDYHPRLVVMATLVTAWGVRLTANFALKGAYQWRFWAGEEDYRWSILRQKPEFQPAWKWTLFNLLFICGYQNALILLFTLPTIVALQHASNPLGIYDYVIAGAMLFFIAFEALADIQHWRFQSAKHSMIKLGKPLSGNYQKGFLDTGLWSYSRHPNYFAEQAIWLCFYLFSIAASGHWLNWSITGSLLLILLFQGSANFSEEISAGKYPLYSAYQQKVRRFWPIKK
ncbi:MAG: DUF1295 domain-containing protein [Saprospiraceae bacterium]|nr:DUF1295 domain-containing protein [Saprospiraceae bacterium]